MRSSDVRAALARKFCAPEYALFYEVGDATGGRARRWADAIAMGLWPSRGIALQGFEIKVSRSDWLNELRQPAKAEAIARYCRYWWIVTPPDLVREGELPERWGHYEVRGNGLKVVRAAPPLDPVPVSPEFLAALLRRSDEHARSTVREAIEKAMVDERAAIGKRIEDEVKRRTRAATDRAETAEATLNAIYAACALEAHEVSRLFYNDDFARAVAVVHRLGIAKTYSGIAQLGERIRPMADAIDSFIAALPTQQQGQQ
ncbi:hypothetical protein [Sphingomonas sp. CCH9-E2]|uniref:hypothetical protein n=1 Tax=Sphingomonas sp. CCH9-E2 TaxID=1768776 RepID=UPI00083647E8|nr:hypothetical protein [Sphingomonas sp. CCH9-E2]